MRRIALLGLMAAAASAGPAFAETGDHGGLRVSLGANAYSGGIDWAGTKPDAELDGVIGEVRIGGDWQIGDGPNGFVFGADYTTSLSELESPANRDGNYLVQSATLEGYSGWSVRGGYAFGPALIYASYGQFEDDLTAYQSCPNDPAAVVAGFCYAGGNPSLQAARAGQHEADLSESGDVIALGLEWNVSDRFFVDASIWRREIGEQTSAYDEANIPPTVSDSRDEEGVRVHVGFRFF